MNQSLGKTLLEVGIVPILMTMMFPALLDAGAQPQKGPVRPAEAPAGDADEGKKLYNKIGCWSCHGYSAQGGRAGPALVPDPLPFPAFAQYVRAPAGEMPPYTTKVLSNRQLADIYAFIDAMPTPPDVKDIPLLNRELQ